MLKGARRVQNALLVVVQDHAGRAPAASGVDPERNLKSTHEQ